MYVVGHQHIGVNRAACLVGIFLEPVQVEALVLIGDEADLTVIASLDDMQGDMGECYAGTAGHGVAPMERVLKCK